MRLFTRFSLFFMLNITFSRTLGETVVKLRMKAIQCKAYPSIYNGSISCSLKPTRDGTGYTTALYNFAKPATDLWASMDTYFKYGTIFRNFRMFNLDIDVCAAMADTDSIINIARFVYNGVSKTIPGLLHKCPYFHVEGFRNISIEKTANEILPQIIPKGEYKAVVRGHTKANQTFAIVSMLFLVDSVDPLKSMQIG